MVGSFRLYADALVCLRVWATYLDNGGSLTAWKAAHPDGVEQNVPATLPDS